MKKLIALSLMLLTVTSYLLPAETLAEEKKKSAAEFEPEIKNIRIRLDNSKWDEGFEYILESGRSQGVTIKGTIKAREIKIVEFPPSAALAITIIYSKDGEKRELRKETRLVSKGKATGSIEATIETIPQLTWRWKKSDW